MNDTPKSASNDGEVKVASAKPIITHKVIGSEWVNAKGEVTIEGFHKMVRQAAKNELPAPGGTPEPMHRFDMGNGQLVEVEKRGVKAFAIRRMVENSDKSTPGAPAFSEDATTVLHGHSLAVAHINAIAKRPATVASIAQEAPKA